MACRLEVLPELNLVLVVLSDVVSFDDLRSIRDKQDDNADFDSGMNQLVIFPPNTSMTVTSEEMHRHAHHPSAYKPDTKRSLFAKRESVLFGMSRMFQLMKDEDAGDIRVFDDFPEACGHVDVDAERVLELLPELAEVVE